MDGKWIGMNSVKQDALPATERKALFVYIGGRTVKFRAIDEHDVCRINKGKHITLRKLHYCCFIGPKRQHMCRTGHA